MIRVGFVLSYTDSAWVGGINYLSNLLQATREISDRKIEPVLIVDQRVDVESLRRFAGWPIVRTPWVDTTLRGRHVVRKLAHRVIGCDVPLQYVLREHGIAVLSHSGSLGTGAGVPSMGWIADFQHRRMPEFFKADEIAARERGYQRLARECTTIVLSSHDAQRDLDAFWPRASAHSRVLQFVAGQVTGEDSPTDDAEALERLGVRGPFFYLPNQFWAHKNHRLAIDALAWLKSRGHRMQIVCTGNTQDRRQPEYFDRLKQHANAVGVSDRFIVLGLVPYADLLALMRNAMAVVNPSLFEGWSTTVEESKSLGLRILLSDLPVHREQAPERGTYFDANDPCSLSQALLAAQDQSRPDEEAAHRAKARAKLSQRFREFGERYQDIVLETHARSISA